MHLQSGMPHTGIGGMGHTGLKVTCEGNEGNKKSANLLIGLALFAI